MASPGSVRPVALRRRFSPGLPLSIQIFEKSCLVQTIFYLLYPFFTLQGLIVSITGMQTGRAATLQACKYTRSPKSPGFGQNREILDSWRATDYLESEVS